MDQWEYWVYDRVIGRLWSGPLGTREEATEDMAWAVASASAVDRDVAARKRYVIVRERAVA